MRGKTVLLLIIFVLCLALAPLACAKEGHIKLLAVYTEEGGKGSVADLKLELKSGTGRVFIETIPLAKIDTQMSTRFAKEIACKFSSKDCSKYDFFYTIKSSATIVGGPSAGAATSTLTVALLENLEVDKELAITGTINSGELIGPIGSVKNKIYAASQSGIKKVLIPAVQSTATEGNITIDLVTYGEQNGVKVIPVTTLGEAVEQTTGTVFEELTGEIIQDAEYIKTMKKVAGKLCNRSLNLIETVDNFKLKNFSIIDADFVKNRKKSEEFIEQAKQAIKEGKHYSAASYCFGSNVITSTLLLQMKDMNESETTELKKQLGKEIGEIDQKIENRSKSSITDLQTYMIVKERILESREGLKKGKTAAELAYVNERLASAVSWSQFFNQTGKNYNLDKAALKKSCELKLKEVDERVQYLNYFFNQVLADITKNLLNAHNYYKNGEYALCLFKASKTEAEANVVVSLLGVQQSNVNALLKMKLGAAERSVLKQVKQGIFPILAYSYYEYANRLKNESAYLSLIYSEYALSLSDIEIYLDNESVVKKRLKINWSRLLVLKNWYLLIFVWGLILGYLYRMARKGELRMKKKEKYPAQVYRGKTKPTRLKLK